MNIKLFHKIVKFINKIILHTPIMESTKGKCLSSHLTFFPEIFDWILFYLIYNKNFYVVTRKLPLLMWLIKIYFLIINSLKNIFQIL